MLFHGRVKYFYLYLHVSALPEYFTRQEDTPQINERLIQRIMVRMYLYF